MLHTGQLETPPSLAALVQRAGRADADAMLLKQLNHPSMSNDDLAHLLSVHAAFRAQPWAVHPIQPLQSKWTTPPTAVLAALVLTHKADPVGLARDRQRADEEDEVALDACQAKQTAGWETLQARLDAAQWPSQDRPAAPGAVRDLEAVQALREGLRVDGDEALHPEHPLTSDATHRRCPLAATLRHVLGSEWFVQRLQQLGPEHWPQEARVAKSGPGDLLRHDSVLPLAAVLFDTTTVRALEPNLPPIAAGPTAPRERWWRLSGHCTASFVALLRHYAQEARYVVPVALVGRRVPDGVLQWTNQLRAGAVAAVPEGGAPQVWGDWPTSLAADPCDLFGTLVADIRHHADAEREAERDAPPQSFHTDAGLPHAEEHGRERADWSSIGRTNSAGGGYYCAVSRLAGGRLHQQRARHAEQWATQQQAALGPCCSPEAGEAEALRVSAAQRRGVDDAALLSTAAFEDLHPNRAGLAATGVGAPPQPLGPAAGLSGGQSDDLFVISAPVSANTQQQTRGELRGHPLMDPQFHAAVRAESDGEWYVPARAAQLAAQACPASVFALQPTTPAARHQLQALQHGAADGATAATAAPSQQQQPWLRVVGHELPVRGATASGEAKRRRFRPKVVLGTVDVHAAQCIAFDVARPACIGCAGQCGVASGGDGEYVVREVAHASWVQGPPLCGDGRAGRRGGEGGGGGGGATHSLLQEAVKRCLVDIEDLAPHLPAGKLLGMRRCSRIVPGGIGNNSSSSSAGSGQRPQAPTLRQWVETPRLLRQTKGATRRLRRRECAESLKVAIAETWTAAVGGGGGGGGTATTGRSVALHALYTTLCDGDAAHGAGLDAEAQERAVAVELGAAALGRWHLLHHRLHRRCLWSQGAATSSAASTASGLRHDRSYYEERLRTVFLEDVRAWRRHRGLRQTQLLRTLARPHSAVPPLTATDAQWAAAVAARQATDTATRRYLGAYSPQDLRSLDDSLRQVTAGAACSAATGGAAGGPRGEAEKELLRRQFGLTAPQAQLLLADHWQDLRRLCLSSFVADHPSLVHDCEASTPLLRATLDWPAPRIAQEVARLMANLLPHQTVLHPVTGERLIGQCTNGSINLCLLDKFSRHMGAVTGPKASTEARQSPASTRAAGKGCRAGVLEHCAAIAAGNTGILGTWQDTSGEVQLPVHERCHTQAVVVYDPPSSVASRNGDAGVEAAAPTFHYECPKCDVLRQKTLQQCGERMAAGQWSVAEGEAWLATQTEHVGEPSRPDEFVVVTTKRDTAEMFQTFELMGAEAKLHTA